jgi:hypothetical protein
MPLAGHPPTPRPDRATRSATHGSCRPSQTPPRVPRHAWPDSTPAVGGLLALRWRPVSALPEAVRRQHHRTPGGSHATPPDRPRARRSARRRSAQGQRPSSSSGPAANAASCPLVICRPLRKATAVSPDAHRDAKVMTSPSVTELPRALEPTTHDTFIDGLTNTAADARFRPPCSGRVTGRLARAPVDRSGHQPRSLGWQRARSGAAAKRAGQLK